MYLYTFSISIYFSISAYSGLWVKYTHRYPSTFACRFRNRPRLHICHPQTAAAHHQARRKEFDSSVSQFARSSSIPVVSFGFIKFRQLAFPRPRTSIEFGWLFACPSRLRSPRSRRRGFDAGPVGFSFERGSCARVPSHWHYADSACRGFRFGCCRGCCTSFHELRGVILCRFCCCKFLREFRGLLDRFRGFCFLRWNVRASPQ